MITYAFVVIALVSLRYAVGAAEKRRRLALLGATALSLTIAVVAGPRGAVLVKVIGLLVMPMGWLFGLLFSFGYVAWWKKAYRWAAAFAGCHLLVLAIGNPALASFGQRHVEGRYARLDPYSEAPFDAVIVLGGGTSQTPTGEPQLGMSGDRVLTGARLYHRGRTPILVTSGSPIEGFSSHDSAAATQRIWQELGVPPEAIVRVDGARITAEEARLHRDMISERQWDRVGLVTSAFHMTRALRRFEAEGVHVVPLPADVRARESTYRGLVSLLPRASAAQTNHTVAWELVGRIAGR